MAFRGMAIEFEDIQGRLRRLGFGGIFSDMAQTGVFSSDTRICCLSTRVNI